MDAMVPHAIKNQRPRRIGIFGTFDVQNYGDLLFPIIAELELSRRLGSIELIPFSYHAKSAEDWPYRVESLVELPCLVGDLDAVLIGGGFIVRFDKIIAPGYEPPVSWIHHPTGYWLVPALMGAQHGVPVVWNAPGMHCNEIPSWSHPLLSLALECSSHIAVRDEPSKAALRPFVEPRRVHVMPDTAFSIGHLLRAHAAADIRAAAQRSAFMIRFLVAVVIAAAAVAGLYTQDLWPFAKPEEIQTGSIAAATDAPPPPKPVREEAAPAVTVVRAINSRMKERVLITGTLVPRVEALIAPEVEGLVHRPALVRNSRAWHLRRRVPDQPAPSPPPGP